MDGFELNKIAGAVLAAMLVIAGGRTLLDIAVPRHKAEKAAWALPQKEPTHEAAKPEPPFDAAAVLALLPKANPDNGASIFKRCLACHTPDKGGRALVGPNLWGIVGRKVAQQEGFQGRYSDAMKEHGGEWTWERLATYLHKPAKTVPGTKMVFAGIPDNADLADLLAYLRTLADNAAQLPQ